MIKVTVNNKAEFEIDNQQVSGAPIEWDIVEVRDQTFHILKNNKSYTATLISHNPEEKTMVVNVNGNDYEIGIKDKYDLLLQKLGISAGATKVVQQIKAPMPGMVINVAVKEGQQVKEGDRILILEAMKMENSIIIHADAVIKHVAVSAGQAVDKGQVLVELE
jgi:acetyl/propionyl-CoA carboxylase alpha subunit